MQNLKNSNWYISVFFSKIYKGLKALFVGKNVSSSTLLLRYYLLTILIGSLLLYSPGALRYYGYLKQPNGETYTYLDSLFTAVSAFSDTGLTIVETWDHYTWFGHLVIITLITLGGIGVLSIGALIINWASSKMNLKTRLNLKNERGSTKLGGSMELIKVAIFVILLGIFLGTLFLTPYFYYNGPSTDTFWIELKGNWGNSFWVSLFHAASAINNAGFDIMGGSSLLPFVSDVYVQMIFIFLIIIGGIGFPVIYDIWKWLKFKFQKNKEIFHWSLFTKITVSAYFLIFFIGLIIVFVLEFASSDPNSLINLAQSNSKTSIGRTFTMWEVINSIIFSTFSTRNAGFSTIPIHLYQESTRIVWSVLMWIGSSPASTAGGIRTTTFALIVIASFYSLRGSKRVFAFKRRIPDVTITKSFVIGMSSLMLIVLSSTVLLIDIYSIPEQIIKQGSVFGTIFFEVSSAFGTTGLSTGITPYLGDISKIMVILLMIIGQLGVSTTLVILSSMKEKKIDEEVIHGEEEVLIG